MTGRSVVYAAPVRIREALRPLYIRARYAIVVHPALYGWFIGALILAVDWLLSRDLQFAVIVGVILGLGRLQDDREGSKRTGRRIRTTGLRPHPHPDDSPVDVR